jgi:hypothetical protein
MAKIVAVHGIGQQFKGAPEIAGEWWPALRGGLQLTGSDFSDDEDFICPFYGYLFRPSSKTTLSVGEIDEVGDMGPDEQKLLELWWREAVKAEPDKVPSPEEFVADETLGGRVPRFAQQAFNALSRSRFFAGIAENLFFGDLKQVVLYLNDLTVHDEALRIVMDKITPDTRVVIGHSLGSVVAYEALCYKPEGVISFLSLGSPLGIRNLIFDKLNKLSPEPRVAPGAWPGRIRYWTNIAENGDIVALQKELAPLFGKKVKDVLVCSGSDAHSGQRYLTSREAGEAIREGLWPRSS